MLVARSMPPTVMCSRGPWKPWPPAPTLGQGGPRSDSWQPSVSPRMTETPQLDDGAARRLLGVVDRIRAVPDDGLHVLVLVSDGEGHHAGTPPLSHARLDVAHHVHVRNDPPLGLALPARRRGNLRVDAAVIAQRDVRDAQSPKPVHQLAGEVELLGRAGEAAGALRVARRANGDIPE